MEANDLPSWLDGALAADPPPAGLSLREDAPDEVLAGDVCVVAPLGHGDGPGRLFVIAHPNGGWCEGMMAGTELELATEVDAILHPSQTCLEYEIVVYSRFHGPIWTVQVKQRVGAVESDILSELEALAFLDEPPELSLTTGIPLQPEWLDPRFAGLRALSQELDSLTDHYRRRHDLDQPILDPLLGDTNVLSSLLTDTGWSQQVRHARAPTALLDRLRDTWPRLSKDEQGAARYLIERAINASGNNVVPPTLPPVSHRDPTALAGAVFDDDEASPAVTVLSHPGCWHGQPPATIRANDSDHQAFVSFESVSDRPLQEVV